MLPGVGNGTDNASNFNQVIVKFNNTIRQAGATGVL
jgi:hypothetical protein